MYSRPIKLTDYYFYWISRLFSFVLEYMQETTPTIMGVIHMHYVNYKKYLREHMANLPQKFKYINNSRIY